MTVLISGTQKLIVLITDTQNMKYSCPWVSCFYIKIVTREVFRMPLQMNYLHGCVKSSGIDNSHLLRFVRSQSLSIGLYQRLLWRWSDRSPDLHDFTWCQQTVFGSRPSVCTRASLACQLFTRDYLQKNKLHGFSPQANFTDRSTEGHRGSAKLVLTFATRGVSRGQRNNSPRPLMWVF
jgi:hypothetical protein